MPTDPHISLLLALVCLLGGLGCFTGASLCFLDALNDADSHGLLHVTHGKTSERRVFGEGLHRHGLGGLQLDDGGVAGLHELGVVFQLLARTSVYLLDEFLEFTGDVGRVTVEHGRVAGVDLTWVVQDDDLGEKEQK